MSLRKALSVFPPTSAGPGGKAPGGFQGEALRLIYLSMSAPSNRLFDFLVVFGLVFLAVPLLNARLGAGATVREQLGLAAVVVVIAWPLARLCRRVLARHAFLRKVDMMVERHLPALMRRRAQLARPDAYGKLREEKWDKEVDYFIDHHIDPLLSPRERALLERDIDSVARRISGRVAVESEEETESDEFSDTMTPADFEAYCADALRRAGWKASLTGASHDQGVDIVAEKEGLRVVLQCKLYTRPVGNKSVQEAAAGRAHERAHRAAVVTNNSYTPAAEQLAATNGVLLLHHGDLRNLDSLLEKSDRGG